MIQIRRIMIRKGLSLKSTHKWKKKHNLNQYIVGQIKENQYSRDKVMTFDCKIYKMNDLEAHAVLT